MRGRFLRRYQRFLVDIESAEGETVTAYCPATGRLTSCKRERAPVVYHRVESPDRRLDFDWWSIRMPASWVIIDTRPANELLRKHRGRTGLPPVWTRRRWKPEPRLEEGGRLDFRLDGPGPPGWIEVKSVTWARSRTGYFPDAPTRRGRRHLRRLIERARRGDRCWLVLVAMRSDIDRIRPAREIDPEFAEGLRAAERAGVEVIGLAARVDAESWAPGPVVPVDTGV